MAEHEKGTPVRLDLPEFAIAAIEALITHEDVHGRDDQCYADVINAFPPEVIAYISGYRAARRRFSERKDGV